MPSGTNFDDFFKWGISMCKKYNQDSVLISNGEGNISYFDQYGNSKMSFSNGLQPAPAAGASFTNLLWEQTRFQM